MKRIFTAAIAVAATALAGAIPARATTFPSLTQIYVASGALDNNAINPANLATYVSCSNMSGQIASIRYQFRAADGAPLGGATLAVGSLAQKAVVTSGGILFANAQVLSTPPAYFGGTVQILSTQSAVFCSAMLVRADGTNEPSGIALHMVRFNPHPGTVE